MGLVLASRFKGYLDMTAERKIKLEGFACSWVHYSEPNVQLTTLGEEPDQIDRLMSRSNFQAEPELLLMQLLAKYCATMSGSHRTDTCSNQCKK